MLNPKRDSRRRNEMLALAASVILLVGLLPNEGNAGPSEQRWVKGSGKVEMKMGPAPSEKTLGYIMPGEEVRVPPGGGASGVWQKIQTAKYAEAYVLKFYLSELKPQVAAVQTAQRVESDQMKAIRSRRSGAVTMGVRGLQARKESGELESQDFKALEAVEQQTKAYCSSEKNRQLRAEIELGLPISH